MGRGRRVRLFCFTVARPRTYEVELLQIQRALDIGVFSCDAHAILSNTTSLATNLSAIHAIRGSMDAILNPQGLVRGDWIKGAALNAPVYLQVWRRLHRVLLEAARVYEAVIKLDPDTLFYAPRLRRVLASAPRPGVCRAPKRSAIQRWHGDDILFSGPSQSAGPMQAMGFGLFLRFVPWLGACTHVLDPREFSEDVWLTSICLKHLLREELDVCSIEFDDDSGFTDLRYGVDKDHVRSQPRTRMMNATPAFHWVPAFKDAIGLRRGVSYLLGGTDAIQYVADH